MTRSDAHPLSVNRRVAFGAGAAIAAGSALGVSRAMAQDATPAAGTPAASDAPLSGGAAVDPQMQEVLDALIAFEAPPLETVTPQVARALPSFKEAVADVLSARGEPGVEEVGDVSHVLFPALDGTELVARIYRPLDADDEALPILVYFHGGGFVIAGPNVYDASPRALANASGAIVAAIAYRQAPENPFPFAADDAYAALQFFQTSAGTVGGDPTRVAVGGESAGGNLATVVSILARDQGTPLPVHQLLVYPVTTFAPTGAALESVEQFAEAVPLSAAALEWFGSYYLSDPAQAADPYVSPLDSADLAGLPPATVILAEIDPLQSQGQLYADALTAAGVETTVTLYSGVTHEFFGMSAAVDLAADAVAEAAAALRTAFGT